jgi:hypothetical protein
MQPAERAARVKVFQTPAFSIGLGARAVDCVFCIRFSHYIESAGHRLAVSCEFNRASRDVAIVSL